MNNIAIIPARSGSKGVIDKNIKLLNNHPLIAYTINAARESGCFSEIHLSTDSEEYAKIGMKYGAKVPFLRDDLLAQDHSSTWDLVRVILDKYKAEGVEFDKVCILQPTSPLRNAEHIKEAFELLKEKNAESVVSVCIAEHSPLICGQLSEDLLMNDFFQTNQWNQPRQKYSQYYRLNGAIYLFEQIVLEKYKNIYESRCAALIMSQEKSIDIDTYFDFQIADLLIKNEMLN